MIKYICDICGKESFARFEKIKIYQSWSGEYHEVDACLACQEKLTNGRVQSDKETIEKIRKSGGKINE